jgi:hypothetical protein
MGLLLELQSRVPDRWFLRRLLPSAVFAAVAFLAGGLGQSRWNDAHLATLRLQRYLGAEDGGASVHTTAALLLYAVVVGAGAFAVPVAAQAVGAFAAGAWPWWLAPVSDRIRHLRNRRWQEPEELRKDALLARGNGQTLRSARLDARAAAVLPSRPTTPTRTGDRLRAAADQVRRDRGLDVETSWVALLLDLPEAARTAVLDARDGYDGACEAMVWSIAYLVLGGWWWPAAAVGAVLWVSAWRWLRRAGEALGDTVEAVTRVVATPGD